MDLVKQMSISCDLNMEGLGSQADISNQFDTGVRSNQIDDQDENNKNGNASISRSGSEDVVNQEYGKVEEERRKHKPTSHWLQYQVEQLEEKRKMVKRRIITKSSSVESLLYSSRNVETVRQQILQIDMFKQLMDVHKEYNFLLPLEAQEDDKKWFDDIDADMLVFKQKIHNWIREAEHDRDAELKEKASVKSKRSSKSSSKSSSSRSSSTRSSRSERALMEKLEMAELKAEAEFMEK